MKKQNVKIATKMQNYFCTVDGGHKVGVLVSEIPETLDDLRNRFDDDLILQFIVRQVIAHSCFSAVRASAKKGKTITSWTFTLPQKRESSALNKLSAEQRKQLSALSADKLEQLLQLLKD